MTSFRRQALYTLAAAAVCVTTLQAQTTLYSHSFNGSGGLLNGVSVDVSNSLSSSWLANSAFLDNGSTDGALSGSALLDLTLQPNAVYSLTVDLTPQAIGGDWGGFGFATGTAADFIDFPAADGGNDDRFTDGPGGQAWALIRDIDGAVNAGDVEFFPGPSTAGGSQTTGGTDISIGNLYNMEILLNTAADGASYTADLFINGASQTGGPVTINNAISTIGSVGLTFNNTLDPGHLFDNFSLTEEIIGAPTNVWNVDGGGSFGVAANWSENTVPVSTATFGAALTAANSPATVTLDSATTLQELVFSNAAASYTLNGPSALTLNGSAVVNVTGGQHTIAAVVQGPSGLTKEGAGTLVLSANNTYTGVTSVAAGDLRVSTAGAVDGAVTVAAGSTFGFQGDGEGGGFTGAFANAISGDGGVVLSNTLTTETVTFSNAKTYAGQTLVNGGTLAISNGSALGAADATAATGTVVPGNASTSKLALSGGISVASETLLLGAREAEAIDATHLTSSGSNTWGGAIKGDLGGAQYNFESTSGTLTLAGTISAPDSGERTFVFDGSGNTRITGRLSDFASDENGALVDADLNGQPDTNEANNVNLVKRGSGTLTVATGTATSVDFHQGTTVVEEGSLVVTAGAGDAGELWSRDIRVHSGAQMTVSSFGTYNLQEGQALGGGGAINATVLGVYDDNDLTPGDDGRGTLNINGSMLLSSLGSGGMLNYDLGDATTVGGAENDLIAVTGSVSGTLSSTVSVTPVDGQLATGSYALFTHNSGSAPNVAGMLRQVVDNNGNVLNPRQTLSVSATSSRINLTVSGSAASLTWNGTAGNQTWDVTASNNWTGGASNFRDLDAVTFGSGGVKEVEIASTVTPGSTTFNSGSTYTVTGAGGITGYGPVNVDAGVVKLLNTGNSFAGQTTVASGARLEMVAASTGGMSVSGTLAVGSEISTTVVEDFSGDLSAFSGAVILDVNGGAANTAAWQITDGALEYNTSTYDDIEQSAYVRSGLTLEVGEELQLDVAHTGASQDIGLYVGGTAPTAGVRQDYIAVYARGNGQVFSRGFDGAGEYDLTGGGTPAYDRLFIARTGDNTFEAGYYENGVRTIVTERTPTTPNSADSIGFYTDVRAAGVLGEVDNLSISTGGGPAQLDINGDFDLTLGGVLELDITGAGFDSLDISGSASLLGEIAISLEDGFSPADGAQFTILSAADGIATALASLDFGSGLPSGFTAAYNDAMTDLILTFGAGLGGDFNGDGVVDAADYTVWRDNFGADEGDLLAGNGTGGVVDDADYDLWSANYGMTTLEPATPDGAAVPEPAALWLLLGMAATAARRRPTAR